MPVWYGIVWGRLGRGDLAWAHLDRVRLPALQPWIAAERGRILRELGEHARAEALEWPALVTADDPVDAAMLRVSLAADAVGLEDRDRASRRLAAAIETIDALPDSPRAARQRLRLGWVAIEVALLVGERPPRDGVPRWDDAAGVPDYPDDHRWGSRFHAAKGCLFAGVVRGDPRLLDAAAELAPAGLVWAVHLARRDVSGSEIEGRAAATAAARAANALVPPPGTCVDLAAITGGR